MGVIKGVLREELHNALHMKKEYEQALKKYPGGSLIRKKIRGCFYYYMAFREGNRVRFIYKGKNVSKKEKDALSHSRNMRKKYKQFIAKLNKRIKYLKKVLNGKEDV